MRRRSRRRGEERRGEEGAGRARQIRAQRGCQNHHKISPDTPLHLGHPGLPAPLIEDRWSPPGVQLLWVRASPPPAPPQPPDRGGRGLGRPSHSLDNWGRLDCYIKIVTAIVQGMDHIEHILHSQGSRGPGHTRPGNTNKVFITLQSARHSNLIKRSSSSSLLPLLTAVSMVFLVI